MNNEVTLTLDQLLAMLRLAPAPDQIMLATNARYALVRGDRSGVFCGVVVSEEDRVVELTDCRHIWYWAGAANVAEMSLTGVARPAECKIIAPVARLRVLDAIEVVDCTPEAEASLRAVPVWSKR